MVSSPKVGFVKQTDAGLYGLGPVALQLGLSRPQRMDPVKEPSELIDDPARETNQSVALAVWGTWARRLCPWRSLCSPCT